jgi:hypothetical protein
VKEMQWEGECADEIGHALPFGFIHLMEDKIKKPAGWLTTIFLKPFWIFQVPFPSDMPD